MLHFYFKKHNTMSEQTIVVRTVEEPALSFIKKRHELQPLARALEKGSVAAAEMLIATMNDPDADKNTRLACAKSVIAYSMSLNEQINNDSMSRQVAQIKFGGGAEKNLTTVRDNRPQPPILDFNTISNV